MATSHNQLSVTYSWATDDARTDYGTSGNWWIRLEQLDLEAEGISDKTTLGEAAEFIDDVYGLDLCSGSGGATDGGEAADPEVPMSQEDYVALARGRFQLPTCESLQEGYREYVYMYRSNTGFEYELEVSYGEIEKVETVQEMVEEFLVFDNQYQYSVTKPIIVNNEQPKDLTGMTIEYLTEFYASDGILENPSVSIQGSTLNFEEPVTGSIKITYPTQYDIITILMEEPQEVSLRAFYHGLVEDLIVEPRLLDQLDLEDCVNGFTRKQYTIVGDSKCYQRIHKDYKCRCTGSVHHSENDLVPVTCKEGDPNNTVYHDRLDTYEYIGCEGEEEDLNDPAFYEETCCTSVPAGKTLPTCRESRQVFLGGEPIVNGKQWWRDKYGDNTAFIALGPTSQFNCGDIITTWNVDARSCCDYPDEIFKSLPGSVAIRFSMARDSETTLYVADGSGSPPFSWGVAGSHVSASAKEGGLSALIKADECFCDPVIVYAKDTCNWYTIWIVSPSDGSWSSITETVQTAKYKWHHDGTTPAFVVHGTSNDRSIHSAQSFRQVLITPTGAGDEPTEEEIETQCCDSGTVSDYQSDSAIAYPDNLDGFKRCDSGNNIWYKEHPLIPGTYIRYYATEGGVDHVRYSEEFTRPAVCEEELGIVTAQDVNTPVIADYGDITLEWEYGIPPFNLSVNGVEVYLDPARTSTENTTNGHTAKIYAKDTCGGSYLTVTDSCGNSVEIYFKGTEGNWTTLYLNDYGGGVNGCQGVTCTSQKAPYVDGCPGMTTYSTAFYPTAGDNYDNYYGDKRVTWRIANVPNQICPHSFYGNYCRGGGSTIEEAQSWCMYCYGRGPGSGYHEDGWSQGWGLTNVFDDPYSNCTKAAGGPYVSCGNFTDRDGWNGAWGPETGFSSRFDPSPLWPTCSYWIFSTHFFVRGWVC